ncbi:MAG: bifunctional DNA primase/polymerase, partial [Patescibacteria group bacterium]|nr:bifunctional DNA primase/polymerase [Patescibacteria group bacterium]
MTAVSTAAAEYIAHGWKVCRIAPGGKGPREKEWNAPGHDIRAPEAFKLGYGVGLLHAFSGTMALDIDNYPV